MPKLNQVVAAEGSIKHKTERALTDLYHACQKTSLFEGHSKAYTPFKDDDTDKLPIDKKVVQVNCISIIKKTSKVKVELFDTVAQKEWANCDATADIEYMGKTIKDVPITYLLFLEKQLVDLHTHIGKLPTLDPSENWTFDDGSGQYKSEEVQTMRTKRIPRVITLAEATKDHPAQAQIVPDDTNIGSYKVIKMSGAMPQPQKDALLEQIEGLQKVVKFAREQANMIDAPKKEVGKDFMAMIFG